MKWFQICVGWPSPELFGLLFEEDSLYVSNGVQGRTDGRTTAPAPGRSSASPKRSLQAARIWEVRSGMHLVDILLGPSGGCVSFFGGEHM